MGPLYPHREEEIETLAEVHTTQRVAVMSSKPRAEIPTLELYTWDNGLAKIRRHIHETTNQDYKMHDIGQGSPKGDQDEATWVEVPGKKKEWYHGTTHNIEEARLEAFNNQYPWDTILVEIRIHTET